MAISTTNHKCTYKVVLNMTFNGIEVLVFEGSPSQPSFIPDPRLL